MELNIFSVPFTASKWDVKRAIGDVVHSSAFDPTDGVRKANFSVKLNMREDGSIRNNGTGFVTFETASIGRKFLDHVRASRIKLQGFRNALRFKERFMNPKSRQLVDKLQKTPYIDPDAEENRERTVSVLDEDLYVEAVQCGFLHNPSEKGPLEFSIEWEEKSRGSTVRLDYDHQAFVIKIGDVLTEHEGCSITLSFSRIQMLVINHDMGKPYICFDCRVPPVLEKYMFGRTKTGDDYADRRKSKDHASSIDYRHAVVAPFAWQIRLVLAEDGEEDVLERFIYLCKTAEVPRGLVNPPICHEVESVRRGFFTTKRLNVLQRQFFQFEWSISFQLEALLRSGLLHTRHLELLLSTITNMAKGCEPPVLESFLRNYNLKLLYASQQGRAALRNPMDLFKQTCASFKYSARHEGFRSRHVTFTPTHLLLEGPYPTESNRIVRNYPGYEDHFIRVDFRDEDRLPYQPGREIDSELFLKGWVGRILKDGFVLGGRRFEFLGYSNSSLREHAFWFIQPFTPAAGGPTVNGDSIRASIGDFKGALLQSPSLYAARLAQAFSATVPSVKLRRCEWDMTEDLGEEPYLHTDGQGTISKALAARIWTIQSRTGEPPSAYQIRFLGFKGVVVVDEQLDKRQDGLQMRLRGSMKKFDVADIDMEEAVLEIAISFKWPNVCLLNRPLVMLLEDLGVQQNAFLNLQDDAIADAKTIDESLPNFCKVLAAHKLGGPFKLKDTLERIHTRYGADLHPRKDSDNNKPGPTGIDSPFLRQLRQVAMVDVLRGIYHYARIPVLGSYHVVGVVDEGPAYRGQPGYEYEDVFLCIQQSPNAKLEFIKGKVSISRSPVAHPGDVQIVYAIGEPPADKICLFKHLRNVVVMPSQGKRSLASCLGGGDVDGDQFSVIHLESLLPTRCSEPASYTPADIFNIGRDCKIGDVCDFIVEYMHADLLGLLSTRLLVIADQSRAGMHDERCLELAELCSKAVDYPKKGTRIQVDADDLPQTLIRMKPDWDSADVVSPRTSVDYYRSDKALGHLFRSIPDDFDRWVSPDSGSGSDSNAYSSSNSYVCPPPRFFLQDPLTVLLLADVQRYLGAAEARIRKPSKVNWALFERYVEEMRYIAATHVLGPGSGSGSGTGGTGTGTGTGAGTGTGSGGGAGGGGALMEAEVVVGTILAKCTQKRWRKDRMYRMRLHAQTLVEDVRRTWLRGGDGHTDAEAGADADEGGGEKKTTAALAGLLRAWDAWLLTVTRRDQFGANSFSLIALNAILECLDTLDSESLVASN